MYRILACLCGLMLFLFTMAPARELHPKLWAPNTTVSMVQQAEGLTRNYLAAFDVGRCYFVIIQRQKTRYIQRLVIRQP